MRFLATSLSAFRRFASLSRCLRAPALASLVLVSGIDAAQAAPRIEQWTAPTGAKVFFVASHELPMIDIQIDFTAGAAFDPTGKSGVAGFTHALLDSGAGELDEQAISERAADLGLLLGGSMGEDRASLTLRTLSSARERDDSVALAATVLAHPRFPVEVLERERVRALANLREALTKPAVLAARAFNAAVYAGHPYGNNNDEKSLSAITREDLVAFHTHHYGARNASIAIVGDLDRAAAEKIAIALTQNLPAGGKIEPLPVPLAPREGQVTRISNPSAQSHILIGQPGMSRDDPDYFPLLVGNHILGGGGFTSRLMKEVREKRGFAYDIHSYFEPRRVLGPFRIGLQTKGSQSDLALDVVRATLTAFIAEGPTEKELRAARDNLVNGFGLRLDSNAKILSHVAMIGFYNLPLDWLDSYPRTVSAVSREAVRDAFARRVRPAHLVTVIAGGDGDKGDGAEAPAKP
ncbi:MAG: insulinase family protein [Betaproteobacteria bacterium]|nr:insulinase family protein [Betaproteobacteria bacterium]